MKTSKEILTHFSCGHCKKWWSIGDAPKRNVWFCPWCGKRQEVKKWTLPIRAQDKNIFDAIKKGEKIIETRVGGKKYEGVKIGDTLIFSCNGKKFEQEVLKTSKFKTISALVKKYPFKLINPFVKSVSELTKMYESFPGYKDRIKQDGILAFELKNPVK
jgi:ASC-1-like (ASCH) protein